MNFDLTPTTDEESEQSFVYLVLSDLPLYEGGVQLK